MDGAELSRQKHASVQDSFELRCCNFIWPWQQQSVKQVQGIIKEERRNIAVDIDLWKFFDRYLLHAISAFPPSLAVIKLITIC
jgi:hypothetical protein